MSINVKARCLKCCFSKEDFRIFSWSPIGEFSKEIQLSKNFTFSTKGNDAYISEYKEYDLVLEETSYSEAYGGTYKIISVPSLGELDFSKLDYDKSFEILMECTSSERIATNILKAIPNFIQKVIEEGKESIDVKLIKGVGEAYLNAYTRNLLSKYKYIGIMNQFKEWLINIDDAKVLIESYKDANKISEDLKSNPYKVNIDVLRRNFEYSDKLILELRPDLKKTTQRCGYLIQDILSKNEENEGSTRLNGNILYNYIREQYKVPELEPLIVPTVEESELFYYDNESKDLSLASTYAGECFVADFIKSKIKNSTKLNIDWTKYTKVDDFEMSEKQSSILKMFCEWNCVILAGYSGAGKTSAIKGLIKLLDDNDLSYTIVAPSGKAAKKISDTVNRTASTIHKKVLKDGEISTDVLICDESSMVDLNTFLMMLRAINNPNIRIVLVGDNAQLQSVGAGNLFNDLINSNKVPMVMLDKIFRYDTSGGLFVATNVRQGKSFFDSEEKDKNGNLIVKHEGNKIKVCNNYEFITCNEDEIFNTIIDSYRWLLEKGYKPSDILILSPQNVGEIGTYCINNAIQSEVNPIKSNNEKYVERKINNKLSIAFRVGDKVLNKKNDYNAVTESEWNNIESSNGMLSSDDVKNVAIFNGQDGKVVRVIDNKAIIVQFDEDLIAMDKNKLNSLLLGNCISVHASQGSEAKAVINVVSSKHQRMLTRNLLYVADTRSKEMQIDIGSIEAYNKALLIDGNKQRDTWLYELMLDEVS